MDDDDAALLAAAGAGSDRAFNLFVDRHQQSLRTFLRGLTREADGDDLAQETLLAAWSQAQRFRGGGSARSWLFGIAWRKAKGAQRTWFRRRIREAAHRNLNTTASTGELERVVALRQALEVLPLDQRAAILLCVGCGLTHNEAAAVLRTPLGTVKSHVSRGKERLAALLEDAR